MAGYVMKMSILVSNINRGGQKDLSFKVRHKAYASRCGALEKRFVNNIFIITFEEKD
ncbi:MAG: hypothetical protein PF448_07625 [Bacteroidales bacterium]|jgi:hypothetical protein|nr:hypothetical protein [Bacteroidales bacterium]